jgi:hypothetical protein
MTSYNQFIFEMTRAIDPELAEDLNRRMVTPLTTIPEMTIFMNGIINQYPAEWARFWFLTNHDYTLEQWCMTYRSSVLPFFCANRLPPVAHDARAIYPL